ncbi:uncharacterized protein PAC_12008 [Phialocephala subalpina]|uniref:Zn(2)-C6 fungal-type domain-containing protein n=1 Tax=Phialocephala subalpina TaxID=576137 RepID=A0A1L7XAQ9_9HELO|nr:uncharacterized protein PAC_12008 [Phialocephala subalpina]
MSSLEMTRDSAAEPTQSRDDLADSHSADKPAFQVAKPPRERAKRACDKCSRSKTRCDGNLPCQHCIDYDVVCTYLLEKKRPGRASRTKVGPSKVAARAVATGPKTSSRRRNSSSVRAYRRPTSHDHDNSHTVTVDGSLLDCAHLNHQAQATNRQQCPQSNFDSIGLGSISYSGQISEPRSQQPMSWNTVGHHASPSTLYPGCRYSVLHPVLPYIEGIIPVNAACELLDLYFTEPSTSLFECASPYVLAQIFRKRSFLRPDNPRKCKPSLLAAMLWVAAQTSNASTFTISTYARSIICTSLHEACIGLLLPSEQQKSTWKSKTHTRMKLLAQGSKVETRCSCIKDSTLSTSMSLDDVLTYALLGTVISGGETRRDCLQWWAKAWSLGKDLNLNQEQKCLCFCLELQTSSGDQQIDFLEGPQEFEVEEMKEERRRTWWLLYIADRHLALSYNAPLNILDAECQVYQPLDEETWQDLDSIIDYGRLPRLYGPVTKIVGVGLFEYFLPLMAILGDIVDIHHRFWHPRFGRGGLYDAVAQVERGLDVFEDSLKVLEIAAISDVPTADPLDPSSPHTGLEDLHPWATKHSRKKAVIAYSRHLLHVLHVLLHGSWDPISMLDNPSHWITPQSFVKCAKHAVLASSAVSEILQHDPELSFMPYLFGIYLMHGSFILLVFADQMEMTTSETVSQACETIIRAHEVCVVTLNTEYQRNFRKVVRSALYSAQGIVVFIVDEQWERSGSLTERVFFASYDHFPLINSHI